MEVGAYVDLAGQVRADLAPRGGSATFEVYCPEDRKDFVVVCPHFCPAREGDTFVGVCRVAAVGPAAGPAAVPAGAPVAVVATVVAEGPPFVQVPADRASVVRAFGAALRSFPPDRAARLYDHFAALAEAAPPAGLARSPDERTAAFISGSAASWLRTSDDGLLELGRPWAAAADLRRLYLWWDKQWARRRLYLLGVTDREIKESRLPPAELYDLCLANPYAVAPLPLDKCATILARLGREPAPADVERGAVLREVWGYYTRRGWTSTPTPALRQAFQRLDAHLPALAADYGLVEDLDSVYPRHAHAAEVAVAERLAALMRADAATQRALAKVEGPCDFAVAGPPGAPPAAARRGPPEVAGGIALTPDQLAAVEEALGREVCIITGGAGAGKCLAPGTLVRLADGRAKAAGDIAVGDLLLAPGGVARVRATCRGRGPMFRVTPRRAPHDAFECNAPHVLTLVWASDAPALSMPLADFLALPPAERAAVAARNSAALREARSLAAGPFDVPLEEFLTWPEATRAAARLFREPALSALESSPTRRIPGSIAVSSPTGRTFETAGDLASSRDRGVCEKLFAVLEEALASSRDRKVHEKLSASADARDSEVRSPGVFPSMKSVVELLFAAIDLDDALDSVASAGGAAVEIDGECGAGAWEVWRAGEEFDVEPVGDGEYAGFELDGASRGGRFVLESGIVTHNTTVIGQIVHNLELRREEYAVCSFTGKAVARVKQVLGRAREDRIATIHRLIALAKGGGELKFRALVVDEASMVTTELLAEVFAAFPHPFRLVLVGDVNQLPPIEAGAFFAEAIAAGVFPTHYLVNNHRSGGAAGDGIAANARAVLAHRGGPFAFAPAPNFFALAGGVERVRELLGVFRRGAVGADRVVALTPLNEALPALNAAFQEAFTAGAPSVADARGRRWHLGDRVRMTENSYRLNIMNGELGRVVDVGPGGVAVDFGESGLHEFALGPRPGGRGRPAQTTELLDLAFAMSVHRFQGSECDFVVLFVSAAVKAGPFFNRNMVYTAITRARRALWLVGSAEVAAAAAAARPWRPHDNLGARLRAALPPVAPLNAPPGLDDPPEDDAGDGDDFGDYYV